MRASPGMRTGSSRRASTASRRSGRPARASRSRPRSARRASMHCSAAGIAPARVVAATGAAALTDTIALTRHGVQAGCAALPGAAALLLQRRVRRRPVRVVRAADRGGRRSTSARLSLSHSPGVRHAALGRPRRAARGGVPRHHRRRQGQRRRLGAHLGAARARTATSRSSSATSRICRVCCGPAAPGRSAASRTSSRRSSAR